jgi:hypothetical protein
MSVITTMIVLAIFYGGGAIVCHTADTGSCRDDSEVIENVR